MPSGWAKVDGGASVGERIVGGFYEFLKRQGTQYHAGSARQKALLARSHRYLKPAEHKQAAE